MKLRTGRPGSGGRFQFTKKCSWGGNGGGEFWGSATNHASSSPAGRVSSDLFPHSYIRGVSSGYWLGLDRGYVGIPENSNFLVIMEFWTFLSVCSQTLTSLNPQVRGTCLGLCMSLEDHMAFLYYSLLAISGKMLQNFTSFLSPLSEIQALLGQVWGSLRVWPVKCSSEPNLICLHLPSSKHNTSSRKKAAFKSRLYLPCTNQRCFPCNNGFGSGFFLLILIFWQNLRRLPRGFCGLRVRPLRLLKTLTWSMELLVFNHFALVLTHWSSSGRGKFCLLLIFSPQGLLSFSFCICL